MRDLPPLIILPGLFTENTDRGSQNRWKDGNHIRFFRGLPEKIGGWQKLTNQPIIGKCRALFDWKTLDNEKFIALGTHKKLHLEKGGTVYNATPFRETGQLTDPFDTTDLSAVVNVSDTGHGTEVGDYVWFENATAVGGITIDGEYTVTAVIDADNYTITHSAAATATANGGGTVDYYYELPIGREYSLLGLGYGIGPYGEGTWGTPREFSNVILTARIWSLDKWGEDLIANVRGGKIYTWDASAGVPAGVTNRATHITQSPATCLWAMVSERARHLIALGAHDGVASDPLLIRWCSSEDYTDWTETDSNTAGSHRLDAGNELYCGVKADSEILLFTDSTYASMVYINNPFQFEITTRGANGGLQGPNAAIHFNGKVWWMGKNDFHVYDGRAQVLPCDVRNHVFEDINIVQGFSVYAFASQDFHEVGWLYCSAGSLECDRYVILNVLENSWSFGTIDRTAYKGNSTTFKSTYGTGLDGYTSDTGYIYEHEVGVDADAQALGYVIDTWDIEIGDGSRVLTIKRLVPDFKRLSGQVKVTVTAKKYPHSSDEAQSSEKTITPTTEFVRPKVSGRQASFRFEGTEVGDDFRMGMHRLELKPRGSR